MEQRILLVGLDGGATKLSGWTVNSDSTDGSFTLGSTNIQKSYSEYADYTPGFQSVDIKQQLGEFSAGQIQPTDAEIRQGRCYTRACVDVISAIAAQFPGRPILAGLGMPGLKTADQRGIAVLLNGPRIPDYADQVEAELRSAGIELAAPIFRIGSDADYCGIGEEYSADGEFRDVGNAYYLGGGTGAADALKLDGELVPLDQTKTWLAKTWELQNEKGKSLERYASAGGIQSIFSACSGVPVEELNAKKIYPPQILQWALVGEPAAVAAFREISHFLAELLYERIATVFAGWNNNFAFMNPNRAPLFPDHPYRGTLLDRLIIGQRLGNLLNDSKTTPLFWKSLLENLTGLIAASAISDPRFREHYLCDGQFNADLIATSVLREAPALGAGIDACLHYRRNR
ncbi:MAG: hypothetical protein ABIA75_02595 [Candidatus Neomarinimicrobiota bacterium]